MTILLAKRIHGSVPTATNDVVQYELANDPTIPQFPQGTSTMNMNSSYSTAPVLTGAAEFNAASDGESLVLADENWVNKHWRPAMGWLYMTTCAFDFVLFPILWSMLQAVHSGQVTSQWQPVTLQGAGLYHIAMGTILGVAAYGRTREKLLGKSSGS